MYGPSIPLMMRLQGKLELSKDLQWDFRLPLVKSINVSGHKYGLVYAGVGWVIWRSKEDLPEEPIFYINYLGSDQPTFTLNFAKAQPMLHVPGSAILGSAPAAPSASNTLLPDAQIEAEVRSELEDLFRQKIEAGVEKMTMKKLGALVLKLGEAKKLKNCCEDIMTLMKC